jgi:hypothetical protein
VAPVTICPKASFFQQSCQETCAKFSPHILPNEESTCLNEHRLQNKLNLTDMFDTKLLNHAAA